jgi:hypothetical protein
MPGARCTRSLACESKKAHELITTGSPESFRHSLHDGSTAYDRALPRCPSRCPGLLATVAGGSTRQLDPSVGGSGPHDFAVRMCVARLATPTRPPHPAPHFVTIASRPSEGRDGETIA